MVHATDITELTAIPVMLPGTEGFWRGRGQQENNENEGKNKEEKQGNRS